MIALVVSFFITASVIPAGKEERYFLPAIPAALALAVAGMSLIGSKLPEVRLKPALLSSVFLLGFVLTPFRFRKEPDFGFAPMIQLLVSSVQFRNEVVLVASDANGEGMFISEIAMREQRPGHIVLRASKTLAKSDWSGNNVTPLFETPMEVQHYLDSIPVSVVILDHSASPDALRNYETLLEKAIVSQGNSWKLAGVYSIWRHGLEYPNAAQMYFRSNPAWRAQGLIRIDMTNMLGKDLTLQLGPMHSNERK